MDKAMSEAERVWWHRFNEARAAGLSHDEASAFAEGGEDVGILRRLVAAACDPKLIGKIVV